MALKRQRAIAPGCWSCDSVIFGIYQCNECAELAREERKRQRIDFFETLEKQAQQVVKRFGAGCLCTANSWLDLQWSVRRLILDYFCNCGLEPHLFRNSEGPTCPITDALQCIQRGVQQQEQFKFCRRWVVFCDDKERQLLRLLLFVFKHTLSKDLIFRIFWCSICRGGKPQAAFEWMAGANVVLNICKDLRDKFPLHWEKYGGGASFFGVSPSKLVHGHGH